MRVTRVSFEAFKSLYDVVCEFDKFTVITGPNGAGKSNLVDALNFLGEAYSHGLEIAVSRHGGYENIAHRRTRRAKKAITIRVELALNSEDFQRVRRSHPWLVAPKGMIGPEDEMHYLHSFSMATDTQALTSDFKIVAEHVRFTDPEGVVLLDILRDSDGVPVISAQESLGKKRAKGESPSPADLVYPFTDEGFVEFVKNRPSPRTTLLVDLFSYATFLGEIREALAGVRVFQLSPHQCRTSGVPTPNAALERHGDNLPGAADHLMRNEPKAWQSVEMAMRAVIPKLSAIEIAHTEDRRLALQFRERGVGRPWTGNEVSDGTMQSLAIFVALFDPRTPIVVIEEPENSVHPWVLRRIVDLASADDSAKQVIMTTHSPVLLDYVRPESIRLMTIRSGRSSIGRFLDFDPDLREGLTNGTIGVFQAYDSGVIPESVPRGLSGEE
jgi:predicted ATPase